MICAVRHLRFSYISVFVVFVFMATSYCDGANILMVTLGGTKSHKLLFNELANGLIPRGHNITFISPFPGDTAVDGLTEIAPPDLVNHVKDVITDVDYLGSRMRMELPIPPLETLRYLYMTCDMMYSSSEVKTLLNDKSIKFDLIIIDGFLTDCATAFVYHYNVPFMFINTVNFCTVSYITVGNSCPYSVNPFFVLPFSHHMNFLQRTVNTIAQVVARQIYMTLNKFIRHSVLKKHFGDDVPDIDDISRNASFILQNSHVAITSPRANLPNVADVACMHCRPAKQLPKDLEDFINGSGDSGFIAISMGTTVHDTTMPERFKEVFASVLRRIPQRVVWKWNDKNMTGMPENVLIVDWLPQQDVLGHPKIKAFINHGGLNSIVEAVYHGVPQLTLPVYGDHDLNSALAESLGYSIKLELYTITEEKLLTAINEIIHNPSYKNTAKQKRQYFDDQTMTPLETAIYWTEYVIRHKGAPHLQSPARNLNFVQFYSLDVIAIILVLGCILWRVLSPLLVYFCNSLELRITGKSFKIFFKYFILVRK